MTSTPSPGTAHAPSLTLPLRFVWFGVASLLLGTGFLVARPDLLATYHYNQHILAVTHLFVLGFLLAIVMGAMYQLVPVALETQLYSERLARWHFVCHAVGVAGMVWTFWHWNLEQVGHYGSLVALGIGFFLYNLFRTLRSMKRWDIVAASIASALFWLATVILAGLYLAASKCWDFSPFAAIPAMHAHAHVGVIGVFLILVVGISFKLVPMFVLSRLQSSRRAVLALGLLNVGLAGLSIGILLARPWKLAFAVVVVGGLVVYAVELRAILRARLRRSLDWGLRYFLTALALLAPVSLLGLVLCWPTLPATEFTTQLENVYGFVALLGIVGFAILGMLYKIAPFLVWLRVYGDAVGRRKVPSLSDMYSSGLQAAGYWTYLPAILVTSVGAALPSGTLVRAGCSLLAVSLAVFTWNLGRVLSHWFWPSLLPEEGAVRRPAARGAPAPGEQPLAVSRL